MDGTFASGQTNAMSWQMVDGSSRRARMNWAVLDHLKLNATNGARRSLMPKTVNPEALLHHIEFAVASAEYAQANRYLTHLFPSILTMPASPVVRDSGGQSSQSTAANENVESTNQKQTIPSDGYVKLTNRPKSQSRFSLSDHELAAGRQQSRSKHVPGHVRELASSDGNAIRDVQKDIALSDENFNTESVREDLFKDRTELRTTVAPSLLSEVDARKISPEGLSTECRVAADAMEFATGRIVTTDVENYGQSFAVLQPMSEEKIAMADRDGEYDALAADEAYRAGCSALSEGQAELALSLLQVASSKCPPNKHTALAKVRKLMAATVEILEKQDVTFNRPVMDKDGSL